MKISIAKLKVAAVDFLPEFAEFVMQYGSYSRALQDKAGYIACNLSVPEDTEKKYLDKMHAAINKLIKLDRKFYKKYDEHIFCKIENVQDMQDVLHTIADKMTA